MSQKLASALFLTGILLFAGKLSAQEQINPIKHEIGLWLGGSFPLPGGELDAVLDSNVGAGGFYRINWPSIFLTEFGFSYATYFSRTTQTLVSAPVYAALVYPLPIPFRIQVFAKLGGGGNYLEVRPQNRNGWNPMLFGGLEFSLLASRKFRVGLRLDGNYIYESYRDPPIETELLYTYLGTQDIRFQELREFRMQNGGFYHFGLMVSFIF